MFKNYFKVAIRNLLAKKLYSLINIGGLAVGMTVAILIGLWIVDELSFDNYHRNIASVAQVMQHQTFNGHIGTGDAIPVPLGPELRKTYGDDFKYLALSSWNGDHILTYGENSFSQEGSYIEPEGPRIMDVRMEKGDINGLREPGSILLSSSVAKAIFGDHDPINQLLKIDSNIDAKVTGVYEDFPFTSSFNDVHFLSTWEAYVNSEPWVKAARDNAEWGNNSFQMYVQIADNTNMEVVSNHIKNSKLDRVPDDEKIFKAEIFLHPMTEWHLGDGWYDGKRTPGMMQYVWLFGIVGAFVLLLACINFMNLSTARSEQRAKEVGIRKSIGSVRHQLIFQFLCESVVTVIFAFAMAIILVSMALPSFNVLADKQIVLPMISIPFWIASVAFILITGFLAGSYPALYLSSFQPVKVLKGTFRSGRLAAIPRKTLVVLQFTVSIVLIIGTIVVYRQIQYTKDRPLGYDNSNIIMMQMKSPEFYGKYNVFRNEFKATGVVEEITESSSPLTQVWSNNGGFEWKGKDPSLHAEFATVWVSPEYGKTVSWNVAQGRDFSREHSTDSLALIINESAVEYMGVKDPVGTTVKWNNREYTIVGVVKDVLMGSPFRPVKQTVYFNDLERVNWIHLKLNGAKSISASLAAVERAFKKVLPSTPFDYDFADVEHAQKFASEERVGKLSGIFAVLAVFISCLGLLGLASFVAEQRTKEIGIRKVLGASVTNLWRMMSSEFVVLVLVACVIAIPLAFYYSSDWLSHYEYRTSISPWIYLAAAAGSLVITLVTVSFQAIKAAIANPVKSLRSE